MKGVVAYDSVHGNTRQVAEAIAEQIRADGYEVEVINLKEAKPKTVKGDFMFIGSPTRGGRMTGNVKDFLGNLDAGYWRDKPIVLFDTIGPLSKDPEKRKKWLEMANQGNKNAASRMREACQTRGLTNCTEILHFAVTGFMGPLASDALAIAKESTHQYLASLR
jgi:flavodoxin